MKIGLFAGSFDPLTNGHIDILKQALKVFDKVIVAVAINSEKSGFLPVEKRVEILEKCTKSLNNVEIAQYHGLTVNFAKEHNVTALIRGLRNTKDFEYETDIEQVNLKLSPDMPTVYFMAKPEYRFISSTVIRELTANKADISEFVPKEVLTYIK